MGRRFFGRGRSFSPVEEQWLLSHIDLPIQQICIELSQSVNAVKNKLKELNGEPISTKQKKSNGFKSSKQGYRPDLGISVRSTWEANLLRYLQYKNISWEYEPKVFFFEGIKHGTVSYTPDIKTNDLWIEVKGYLKPEDKTKIRRFKKFYPEEFKKLRAVVGKKGTMADVFFHTIGVEVFAYYNDLKKEYSKVLSLWE